MSAHLVEVALRGLRMRLVRRAIGVGLLLSVTTSAAEPPGEALVSGRAELGVVVPLGAPLATLLTPGPSGQLLALVGLKPWLAVELQAGYFFLPRTVEGGLREGSSGLSIGPGVRLQRPAAGHQLRPWVDVAVLYHRTGDLNRLALSPGVGLNVRLDPSHAFWFGPQVRYLHVLALGPIAGSRTSDSSLLVVGLAAEFDVVRSGMVAPAPPTPVAPVDRDHDGVPDGEDRCADQAGPAALQGCPDGDGDGVADWADKCPTEPEDRDGHADDDGCPELEDSDGDSVADADDACPHQAGPVASRGCPALEVKNVRIDETRIELLQKVLFETGQAGIQAASFGLLDEVARVLQSRETVCVRIEGHTDNQGDSVKNLELSKGRALAVKTYLEGKGVAAPRLLAEGHGDSMPLGPNTTPEGRELNRRVVFSIIPCQQNGAP